MIDTTDGFPRPPEIEIPDDISNLDPLAELSAEKIARNVELLNESREVDARDLADDVETITREGREFSMTGLGLSKLYDGNFLDFSRLSDSGDRIFEEVDPNEALARAEDRADEINGRIVDLDSLTALAKRDGIDPSTNEELVTLEADLKVYTGGFTPLRGTGYNVWYDSSAEEFVSAEAAYARTVDLPVEAYTPQPVELPAQS